MVRKKKSQNREGYFPDFIHLMAAFDNVTQRLSMSDVVINIILHYQSNNMSRRTARTGPDILCYAESRM